MKRFAEGSERYLRPGFVRIDGEEGKGAIAWI